MAAEIALKGLAIGFSIAAPVGPIGVLCIRRTLSDGQFTGLATGLGAATADAAYGGIAAFGLTAISSFLVGQSFWLGMIGGLFLCYLGIRTFMASPAERPAEVESRGWVSAYLSTFLLTLTNPMTIMSFVGIFAGIGLGSSPDYASAGLMVAGVFVGSAAWWLILTGGVGILRGRFTPAWMRTVNRCSGALIIAFGLYSLVRGWPK